ncbi:MAG TPA: ThiF family adenylyltransferase [Planctomycetota bacterium]|nr:ThiF family adenylyltransferase [Planctomycetota bacterium]
MSAEQRVPRRFDRQMRFAALGEAGQARLEAASVLVVGCGALGGSLAQTMARAGLGRLVIVDRDLVELSNLPRQVLFDERHVAEATPKAFAARESLERAGGPTRIEAHARHLDAALLEELGEGVDLVLDGTDNLSTRYLLNDFAVSRGIAWVYGGVVGSHGLVLPVLPRLKRPGACLRCLFPEPPPAQSLDTCETAGVILPAVSAVAALQSAAALRWLSGDAEARAAIDPALVQLDVWTLEFMTIRAEQQKDCPCCVRREFPFLEEPPARSAVVLCGRNMVQVRGVGRVDVARVRNVVREHASSLVEAGPLLRFDVEGLRVTLFPDGRALIDGTDDAGRARAVYDRYIGT